MQEIDGKNRDPFVVRFRSPQGTEFPAGTAIMLMIPINTDAPIYHWPVVTVGLIAVNAAVFALAGQPREYMLVVGDGWHPVQWVSAAFLHADPIHLIGNMFFLWAYGLVVEGKLGWWRFLATYLLIAVIQHAVVQTAFGLAAFGTGELQPRYVLGASGAISGLMAIALLWAPVNEFTVIWGYSWSLRVVAREDEMSVWTFSLWFIGWDLLAAYFTGFPLSTPVLHLTGVGVGLISGLLFLQFRWVDCERSDVFSLCSGRRGTPWKQVKSLWGTARSTLAEKPKKRKPRVARPRVVYLQQPEGRHEVSRRLEGD
jgi:membrane associated rhomboid family serine protease